MTNLIILQLWNLIEQMSLDQRIVAIFVIQRDIALVSQKDVPKMERMIANLQ
jgi:hypothetical protein